MRRKSQAKRRSVKSKRRTLAALDRKLARMRAATDEKVARLLALAGDRTKPANDRIRALIELGKMVGQPYGEILLSGADIERPAH